MCICICGIDDETSLRMQRKPIVFCQLYICSGNISAHAEKTVFSPLHFRLSEKHLCACRENSFKTSFLYRSQETSLRMQRKLSSIVNKTYQERNISAHAEKTLFSPQPYGFLGKHLCACRENAISASVWAFCWETSLRMQRKRMLNHSIIRLARNISAHAEKTHREISKHMFI